MNTRDWQRIERHYGRPCELNERGEIVYRDCDFPVGYIATAPDVVGYLVDTTGDSDELIFATGKE